MKYHFTKHHEDGVKLPAGWFWSAGRMFDAPDLGHKNCLSYSIYTTAQKSRYESSQLRQTNFIPTNMHYLCLVFFFSLFVKLSKCIRRLLHTPIFENPFHSVSPKPKPISSSVWLMKAQVNLRPAYLRFHCTELL